MNHMHTNGMKIAISIPEDIFREIEKIAREQRTSRSRVIAAAAREYAR
ncbi:MAG: ribbon-helix-helix protein, CopG family, partial [Candidatus Aminicenantes bacterium]|nr:ribbon-helix-helix protein, CopG family [Candidatus Aminicenantes bacterium]